MITNRQKSRLDEEAPVLFRLPNLRSRDLSTAASSAQVTSTSDAVGNSLRIDAAAPSFSVPVRPEFSDDAVTLPVGHDQTAGPNQSPSPISSPMPAGRRWMDKIGSRLILLVTLMVIVSAAWLTGQRMPASKPDIWQAPELSHVDTEATLTNISGDKGVSTVVPGHASHALSSAVPLPATDSPNDFLPKVATTVVQPKEAPSADPFRDKMVMLDAPATNSSSTQHSSTSIFDTVTLEPADLGDPSSRDVQPLEQISPTTSATSEYYTPDESGTVSTATPNAPVFEPSELLAWLNRQTVARETRISVTPNPIVDWSLYLPGPEQSVSAASATQSPGNGITTQQAAFPNGVTVNPYGQ